MEHGRPEKSWLLLVFIALFVISACKKGEGQNTNRTPPVSKTPTGNITEITLERSVCFGQCPAYRVILRQNRQATYIGEAYVPLIGTYEAANDSCSDCNFAELATSLEVQGFFELKEVYHENLMDDSNITVSVIRNGEKKTVTSRDSRSPIELWGIAMTIDGVVSKIHKWNKVSSQRLSAQ